MSPSPVNLAAGRSMAVIMFSVIFTHLVSELVFGPCIVVHFSVCFFSSLAIDLLRKK